MSLAAFIHSRAELSLDDRRAMFELMDRHYENMRPERFAADLDEKQWVIRLVDGDTGRLCGFSTQRVIERQVAGRAVRFVYSGDTIVDREHWGSATMAIAWGRLVFHLLERFADQPLYWYLISKGFRTYRFLPVYFREFYPRHDAATPPDIAALIDAVAQDRFGTRYDPARGVVRAAPESDRLRPEMGELPDSRLHDPHVRFFVERNPGHAQGDELCCLAPLTRQNFSATAERLIRSPAFAHQPLQFDDLPARSTASSSDDR